MAAPSITNLYQLYAPGARTPLHMRWCSFWSALALLALAVGASVAPGIFPADFHVSSDPLWLLMATTCASFLIVFVIVKPMRVNTRLMCAVPCLLIGMCIWLGDVIAFYDPAALPLSMFRMVAVCGCLGLPWAYHRLRSLTIG